MKRRFEIKRFIYILIIALIPIVSGVFYCLLDGKSINDIYIPLGGWSDEITYYKQIEGMLTHGMPRGYFGYNQSKALYGSLGVWGILPLIPYVIWGVLFGWNYTSPIWANIFISSLGLVLFSILLPMKKKWVLAIAAFWLSCNYMNRHILSGVVEAWYIAQLVFVIGCGEYLLSDMFNCANSSSTTRKKQKLILALCMFNVFMLTIARPYYAVFFLIPLSKFIQDKNKGGIILTPFCAILACLLYFANTHYFCSSYFSNSIQISMLFSNGISGIVKHVASDIVEIAKNMWYAVRYQNEMGWYYIVLFVEMGIMLWVCIYRKIKKMKFPIMYLISLICDALIVLSFILIYNLSVAGRHFLALIVTNAILMIIETHWKIGVFLSVLCFSLAILLGNTAPIPYQNEEYVQWMEEIEGKFDKVVTLTDDISYENVVAMPTADVCSKDGKSPISTYYGLMFALPGGVGVSLDFQDYYDDLENLRAGYFLVHPQGSIRYKLESMGMECLIEEDEFMLYKNDLSH